MLSEELRVALKREKRGDICQLLIRVLYQRVRRVDRSESEGRKKVHVMLSFTKTYGSPRRGSFIDLFPIHAWKGRIVVVVDGRG